MTAGTTARRPLVISHRTNAGTALPNSLEGIAAALADGVDGVEMDVRSTRDGIPVLWHDATIERAPGVVVPLSGLTLEALRAGPVQRAGHVCAIVTLEAALAAVGGRTRAVLDIKERGLAEAVTRLVHASGAQSRCWVWAFDPVAGAEYERELPQAQRALLVGTDWDRQFDRRPYLDVAREYRCAAVSLEASLVTPDAVAEAQADGLHVYTWTVNDAAELARVQAAGVDGVCTDYPARAREAFRT